MAVDQRPHRAFVDVADQFGHRRSQLLRGDWNIVDLSSAFVPDVILFNFVASRALAGSPAKGQQLLVRGADQMLAKRCAFGKRLLGIAQRARVKVGLDVVVARLPVRVGAACILFGFKSVQLLDGRDRPFHPGRGDRVLAAQGGEEKFTVHHARHLRIVPRKGGRSLF